MLKSYAYKTDWYRDQEGSPKKVRDRSAYNRERYAKLKAQGKCWCGNDAVPGNIRCATCINRKADWSNASFATRVLKGLCGKCGSVPVEKFTECFPCRKAKSDRRSATNQVKRIFEL